MISRIIKPSISSKKYHFRFSFPVDRILIGNFDLLSLNPQKLFKMYRLIVSIEMMERFCQDFGNITQCQQLSAPLRIFHFVFILKIILRLLPALTSLEMHVNYHIFNEFTRVNIFHSRITTRLHFQPWLKLFFPEN